MKKIFNMWRMTRDLEKESLELHKNHVPRRFLEIEEQKFEITGFTQRFAQRKKMTDQQALKLLYSCQQAECIEILDRGNGLHLVRVNDNKGTDLTDTVFGFPIGLVEAEWEKHGRFIAGVFTGLIVPVVIELIKWGVSHHL
jgi:hypothetical protein